MRRFALALLFALPLLAYALPEEPLRVGGDVSRPERIKYVRPKYTETARRARISGVVIVELVIDRKGNVVGARVLKPLPMGLDQSAIDAVLQWKYKPAMFKGQPVAVYYTVPVEFKLPEK